MAVGARRRGVNTAARPQRPFRSPRPYRGVFAPPYNDAAALTIPTPNGLGAMHPDVVDLGSQLAGYRYWMAMTPYNGTADTEIPSVVATNDLTDGGTWAVPTSYTNPVTPDQAGATHMADADIVFDESTGRVYVFYVVTDESTFQDIRCKWTSGGGGWSTEITVLSGALDAYTNPSIVRVGSTWRLYYTHDLGALDALEYRESATAPDSGYGSATVCSLPLGGRKAQNINAVKDTDGTIVLVIGDGDASGLGGALYFARTTDGGTTFQVTGPPIIERSLSGWDSGGIYRSSVLTSADGTVVVTDGLVDVWYSAYAAGGLTNWGTGHTRLPAEFLRL